MEENHSFKEAREHFEEIIIWLQSEQASELRHNDVEENLKKNGTEVLRKLLQGYLDQRATEEIKGECIDNEGEIHKKKRKGNRKIMSIFGEVQLERIGYKAEGKKIRQPLEAQLNLPPEKYSHSVRKMVASVVAKNGFDEGVEAIKRNSGAKIAKRQLEECARRAARDFDEFYQNKPEKSGILAPLELLIISVDGKGVIMREEDLREETRKKAQRKKKTKSKHRLSPGEKRNRKRMATVATVYGIEPNKRTVEQIVNSQSQTKKSPPARNKRLWASVIKTPEQVIAEAFAEARRRDPQRSHSWVALVDGNPTQIRLLKKYAKKYQVQLTIILDIIHVIEYLWNAAHVFHPVGSVSAEDWVSQKLGVILRGKASGAAAGMRRSATNKKLTDKKREQVDKCANYLLKYKESLRYEQYLSMGFPIATGVIEGACRYLVKDRMELTGARWSALGAEAVLRLRALIASGEFEAYWSYHLDCEYQRHHRNLYQHVPQMQIRCYSYSYNQENFSHFLPLRTSNFR